MSDEEAVRDTMLAEYAPDDLDPLRGVVAASLQFFVLFGGVLAFLYMQNPMWRWSAAAVVVVSVGALFVGFVSIGLLRHLLLALAACTLGIAAVASFIPGAQTFDSETLAVASGALFVLWLMGLLLFKIGVTPVAAVVGIGLCLAVAVACWSWLASIPSYAAVIIVLLLVLIVRSKK